MDDDYRAVLRSLKRNDFDARYTTDGGTALKLLLEMIPTGSVVGLGDPAMLRGLGLCDELIKRGIKVVCPEVSTTTPGTPAEDNPGARLNTLRRSLGNDVHVTGTNAITLDGKLVSVDGTGYALAGMIYGAPRVIVVASRDQIVENVPAAIRRIKEAVAPARTGTGARPQRPYNIPGFTSILEKRPRDTDIKVILVDNNPGGG